jgi:hypothetical protein
MPVADVLWNARAIEMDVAPAQSTYQRSIH